MGKASSSKKVARAASTGGGRTARGRTPWLWYSVMSLVVILGVFVLAISRNELDEAAADPPVIGQDHWHAAYGINICGTLHPGLNDTQGDRYGIHSHADGLIHIHPTSANSAGDKATLGVFLDEVGVDLTSTSIDMPDADEKKNGAKCGTKAGKLQVAVWETPDDDSETIVKGDPNDLRLKQAQVILIAFVPDGTDLQKPPSASNVSKPSDLPTDLGTPPPSTPDTTVAGATTTAPPAAPPTTTAAPPTTTATSAP